MNYAYEALVRQSGATGFWPLGRYLGVDVIGGNHFTSTPAPNPMSPHRDSGDYSRLLSASQVFSRSAVLTATNNFTMELWVRALSQDQSWSYENNNGGSNGYVFQTRFADGRVWAIAQGVALLETTARSARLGEWAHWVFMRNANVWQYYQNTIRMDTGANSNAPIAPSGATMRIVGDNADFMAAAIYTRVLAYSEIVEHYKAGLRSIGAEYFAYEEPPGDVNPPRTFIGFTGYEPEIEGPEVLDTIPLGQIDFEPFTPNTAGSLNPPLGNIGFWAGPIMPGSDPPESVPPVFVDEGGLPPFVPPSLPPTIPPGTPTGPGVPLPPLSSGGLAGIRFYQGPPWRWLVTTRASEPLTFLDRLAFEAEVAYVLNRTSASRLSVPADNPEVNIPADDGYPFVNEGDRLLYGFRREGGTGAAGKLWVCRFAGTILNTEDTGLTEDARTIAAAADPWQLLYQRPMVNIDGEFPDTAGFFSFNDTQVGVIALTFLRNTIINHGDVGIDMGDQDFATVDDMPGTSIWGSDYGYLWGDRYKSEYEATTQVDMAFQQGLSVGEVWDQLVQTGLLDIVLTPVYDPINRPGITHEISIFNRVGTLADDAVMAWDKPGRNLIRVNHVKDGLKRANTVRYFEGMGGPPVAGGIPISDGASITRYGEYWAQQFFPGRIEEAVLAFAELQLALRADGVDTVEIEPTSERAPFVFTEWFVGDTVPIYASSKMRAAIAGFQRVYGFTLKIDQNSYETMPRVLGSPEDA